MRAGIALGSNLGDRLAILKAARAAITALPQTGAPLLVSPVYETDPVGCEAGAPRFFNAVIEIDWSGEPLSLLQELRRIEAEAGRSLFHARNISRTLDLDLLYVGAVQISGAEMELPHPRMHARRFVLQPLAEIRPDLTLPGEHTNVATLLRNCGDGSGGLVRAAAQW